MIVYFVCFLLLSLGIYCVAAKKNLIKIIIGIIIMEYSISLFLAAIGYRTGGVDPVLRAGESNIIYVDPLPQALALVVIVIGLATNMFLAAIAMRIHDRYKTFNITKIRRLQG